MAAKSSTAAVANEFLKRSGREGTPLTPMQLLKLVYIAHGWHMAAVGNLLFTEEVQAWKYGPVVPSLFHEFKRYGSGRIDIPAYAPIAMANSTDFADLEFEIEAPFLPEEDRETSKLIDWVWGVYGHLDGWKLSELTHKSGTPWYVTVEKMKRENSGDWVSNLVIPNDLIKAHYVKLWEERNV